MRLDDDELTMEERKARDLALKNIREAFERLTPAVKSITRGLTKMTATLKELVDHEVDRAEALEKKQIPNNG